MKTVCMVLLLGLCLVDGNVLKRRYPSRLSLLSHLVSMSEDPGGLYLYFPPGRRNAVQPPEGLEPPHPQQPTTAKPPVQLLDDITINNPVVVLNFYLSARPNDTSSIVTALTSAQSLNATTTTTPPSKLLESEGEHTTDEDYTLNEET